MKEKGTMIIFDLDGTLSIVGDRIKYLNQSPKDWDSFYNACDEDEVNEPIKVIFRALDNECEDIYIVTGRREGVRTKTLKWLFDNGIGVPSSHLYMRKDGDLRHDTEVKPELVTDFINEIKMIFEDRNSMVKKWREMGIVCLQVAEGDF